MKSRGSIGMMQAFICENVSANPALNVRENNGYSLKFLHLCMKVLKLLLKYDAAI